MRKRRGVDISKLVPVFGKRSCSLTQLPAVEPERATFLVRKRCRDARSRDRDKEDFTGGSDGKAEVCSGPRAKKQLLRPPAPSLALTSLHTHGCVAVCRHGLRAATQAFVHVHAEAQTDACGHMRAQAHVHILTNSFHRCGLAWQTSGFVCEHSGRGKSCVPSL